MGGFEESKVKRNQNVLYFLVVDEQMVGFTKQCQRNDWLVKENSEFNVISKILLLATQNKGPSASHATDKSQATNSKGLPVEIKTLISMYNTQSYAAKTNHILVGISVYR